MMDYMSPERYQERARKRDQEEQERAQERKKKREERASKILGFFHREPK